MLMNKPLLLTALVINFLWAPNSYADVNTSDISAALEDTLDLRIGTLKKGQKSPFDGILLTPDSLTKIQLDYEKKIEELEFTLKYDKLNLQLQLDSTKKLLSFEKTFHAEQMLLKNKYISELETRLVEKDSYTPAWVAGGFLVGCLTTIAIAYSLKAAY